MNSHHSPLITHHHSSGDELHQLIARLYPLCRSITGPGVRATLAILQEYLPIEVHEVPTGTPAFDWRVPQEWQAREAFIEDCHGERLVDFQTNNLHLVGYSRPVRRRLAWRELREHVFTLPEHPDWIPYRTSYYQDNWGFCLSHNQWRRFAEAGDDAEYDVVVDTSLSDGSLTYGECFLPGDSPDEVLLSCHICHPSLANDNLSGMAVATLLMRHLRQAPRRLSYRLLLVPATIGPLVWLSRHQDALDRIKHGLVLTLLGDGGHLTYKQSRRGNAAIDRAVGHVLAQSANEYRLLEFEPFGYDERQYCSPGINLPVGCLMRTPHGQFPEYHTSADNLDFVQPDRLADSLAKCIAVVELLEADRVYVNLHPFGEPQLGRRGLYRAIGGEAERTELERAVLWTLNLADGRHSLLQIAERAGMPFHHFARAAELLLTQELIAAADEPQTIQDGHRRPPHKGETT
jgi:aminopeptidase-like protein